ncbi:MAG: hypothetical protein HQL29_04690 [Candidatus Omnitrophica bacterium]|nr:hypothetical protein [Candidatus Omnitrophota bacterium]
MLNLISRFFCFKENDTNLKTEILAGIREKIIKEMPVSLRNAIAVGIGLMITFVGFE